MWIGVHVREEVDKLRFWKVHKVQVHHDHVVVLGAVFLNGVDRALSQESESLDARRAVVRIDWSAAKFRGVQSVQNEAVYIVYQAFDFSE